MEGILVDDKGSVIRWISPLTGRNIIFPEQEVEITGKNGAVTKRRGGGFACCPFSTMPNTVWNGLPAHGLLRTGLGHTRKEVRHYTDASYVEMDYEEPCDHKIQIEVGSPDRKSIHHLIRVINTGDRNIPVSLGFHPYFSTEGEMFSIIYGDTELLSLNIEEDKPIFLEKVPDQKLFLNIGDQVITLELKEGYTHFCIWTDKKDSYICVEPVFGHDEPFDLGAGGTIAGICLLEVS